MLAFCGYCLRVRRLFLHQKPGGVLVLDPGLTGVALAPLVWHGMMLPAPRLPIERTLAAFARLEHSWVVLLVRRQRGGLADLVHTRWRGR